MAAGRLASRHRQWLRTGTQAALEKPDEVWLTELARLLPGPGPEPQLRPELLAERWQRQRPFDPGPGLYGG
jgi:hypothetical protein